MANEGLFSWVDIGKSFVWLAGREIGTGISLRLSSSYPGGSSGSLAPAGFVHQSGGASPQASTGAIGRGTYALVFDPQLNDVTYRHIKELQHTQANGLPSLWLPFPRVESWSIRSVERNTWSLAGTISGTGGVRGIHVVPNIKIRDAGGTVVAATVPADHPGAATLTIVAVAPTTDSEIQVDPAVDVTALETLDLTAFAGGSLVISYFGFMPVQILDLTEEISETNRLVHELEVQDSPPLRDYEADT